MNPTKEMVHRLEYRHVGFKIKRNTWADEVCALLLYVGTHKVFVQMYRYGKKSEETAISNEWGNRKWVLI